MRRIARRVTSMPPRRSASFFASTNKSTLRAPFARPRAPFGWPKVALMLLTWAEETVIPLDFKVAMMSFGRARCLAMKTHREWLAPC